MDPEQIELNRQMEERLSKLPKVVQEAIKDAEVEHQLQKLADIHKLHLDQWELLETEVKLAMLGFQPAEDLPKNIRTEVGLDEAAANALAADISKLVFEPIRRELERQLGNENAVAETASDVEEIRTQVLAKRPMTAAPETAPATVQPVPAATQPAAPVVPGTPPAPPPQGTAVRAPVSEIYKAGESSTARKAVHDDPYRESPV